MTAIAFQHGLTKNTLDYANKTRGEPVTFSLDGTVTGLYIYQSTTTTLYPRLYRVSDGALLSSGAGASLGAGWQVLDLPDVAVTAGTEYMICVYADSSHTNATTYETRDRSVAHSHSGDGLNITLGSNYHSVDGDVFPSTATNSGAEWNFGAIVTVDNPGVPPVTAPNGGEVWDAVHSITWTASSNSDGRSVTYDIELTTDGGSTWSRLASSVSGTSYSYDFSPEPNTTTARVRVRAYDGYRVSAWDESNANFTIQHNAAPYAPTLTEPGNGTTVDLTSGGDFKFVYEDPNAGDSMASYAFRRKVSGAASYEYWNVGTAAWQSTEVFNTLTLADGATGTVTFGSGTWTNDTTYQWSVRARDNGGATGPYASDFTVTTGTGPAITVDAPSGTVTDTTSPVVAWTYSDAENDPQNTYHVKVFTETVAAGAGFDPDTSTAVWDSTETASSTARDIQVGTDLTNGESYRAYVRVKDDTLLYSDWTYSAFSIQLDSPAAPSLSATYEEAYNHVLLIVTGNDTGPVYDTTNTVFRIEFSDDDGSTWKVLRDADALEPDSVNRQATTYDEEAPISLTRKYRAKTEGTV